MVSVRNHWLNLVRLHCWRCHNIVACIPIGIAQHIATTWQIIGGAVCIPPLRAVWACGGWSTWSLSLRWDTIDVEDVEVIFRVVLWLLVVLKWSVCIFLVCVLCGNFSWICLLPALDYAEHGKDDKDETKWGNEDDQDNLGHFFVCGLLLCHDFSDDLFAHNLRSGLFFLSLIRIRGVSSLWFIRPISFRIFTFLVDDLCHAIPDVLLSLLGLRFLELGD